MQLKPNALIERGKYRIIGALGHGGFGITYLAEQVMTKRKVCIKEFFPKGYYSREDDSSSVRISSQEFSENMERFKAKFIKEAQTIASLDHSNIIHIHDAFEENGTAYYVMEYVEGGSLRDIVKEQGPLSESDAKRYIRAVASALSYIHEQKINHLDVKPGNIMVRTKDDSAILIDFGLAKHYDIVGDQTSSTPVGISHGDAPIEQYTSGGVREFSPSTDIYGLGATLYFLVTGEVPPHATDVGEEGLPKLPDHLSHGVCQAIIGSMQYWRKDRPQSVKEFLKLLDDDKIVAPVAEATIINVEPKSVDESTVIDVKPKQTPKPAPQPKNEPKPKKSKRGLWLGIFLFILAAVASFILFGGGSKESKQIDRTEQMRQDSIARAQFMADSTAKAERELFVRDSTAKVGRELFVRDSIVQVEREKSIQDSVNRANAEQKMEVERKAEEQRKADEDAKARKAATLQLNKSSITHSYTAGDYELTFKLISPYPGMEVSFSESANWITKVKVGNQKLSYSVSANSATSKREATITLNYNGKNHNVKVTQNGKPEDKPKPVSQPNNEIWYTSSDDSIVVPEAQGKDVFGAEIESNTYKDGKGILKFNGDVTTIGVFAFRECSSLTSVTIPNSVTTISNCAFECCSNLTSVTIPNSVTTIGWEAFSECGNLTSVTIPDSVTKIEDRAFVYCSSLKEFKSKFASPDGRCLIVNGKLVAFAPAGITEYTIPNSVTTIIDDAFYGCESLESVTIPNSVKTIGELAFCGCSNLKEFKSKFASPDGRCLIIDGVLVAFAPAGITKYTIPNSVTTIGWYAFCLCDNLTSVTIPNSVTTIGGDAFRSCDGLTSVTIPNSVTTIGALAFWGCNNLTSVTIPNSVKTIGELAFYCCYSLKSVSIPNSVTTIEEDAFRGCYNLSKEAKKRIKSINRHAL